MYRPNASDKSSTSRRLRAVASATLADPEHVREYTDAWIKARVERGVSKAKWERSYFENHVVEAIGHMTLGDVRPTHIRPILEDVAAKGLKRSTVVEVRGVLNRVFDHAWRAELIDSNPVARVKVPEMREVKKERCILTDEEFLQFIVTPPRRA